MAYINHPLVGDDVYGTGAASAVRGRNDLGFVGQALHAERAAPDSPANSRTNGIFCSSAGAF